MAPREPPPRPFLKWVGGKRQLLPDLLAAVQAAGAFRHYHEPFVGGGALFFALARAGRLTGSAFLSDINQNLMDAYIGIRDDVDGVVELLNVHKKRHSEDYFYKIRARVPRSVTQRAARIIYLNKTCFNGLYRENSKGQFNAPFGRYRNPLICDEENLRAVAKTLQRADLGVCPFTSVLDAAKPDDLVYFDPPYDPVSETADFTSYSRHGFGTAAQEELARVFTELAGRGVKAILSNSSTTFVRQLYRDFCVCPVLATRLVNSRADRRGKISEVLVTSFLWNTGVGEAHPTVNGKKLNGSRNGANRKLERLLVTDWLVDNGYSDVAAVIEEVVAEWQLRGKRTRRNWWEILAGDSKGNPRIVAGRPFPVLRAAQIRQGVPVTDSAIYKNPHEKPPRQPVRSSIRRTSLNRTYGD